MKSTVPSAFTVAIARRFIDGINHTATFEPGLRPDFDTFNLPVPLTTIWPDALLDMLVPDDGLRPIVTPPPSMTTPLSVLVVFAFDTSPVDERISDSPDFGSKVPDFFGLRGSVRSCGMVVVDEPPPVPPATVVVVADAPPAPPAPPATVVAVPDVPPPAAVVVVVVDVPPVDDTLLVDAADTTFTAK